MSFILNWIIDSIAIALATYFVPGLQPFGSANRIVCFVGVGLFLGIVNALIKPIFSFFSLPITVFTLGLFTFVINAICLELASYLSVNILGAGISIHGFLPALIGSILVSIFSAILSVLL